MDGIFNKSRPIAIVGAGALGLSTSLHLSRAGYKDITVFERDPSIPSKFSAANDLNKIVRAEYEDPFYTELALVGSENDNIQDSQIITMKLMRGRRTQSGSHQGMEDPTFRSILS